MASMPIKSIRDCSQETAVFIGRFNYDVLVYTLRKSGFPETSLPTTDLPENVYHQDDLVRIAGASVLRTSLIMRDKWKRMFTSRLNSCGFTDEDVPEFLSKLVICCPLSRENHTQSMIQLYFASSNEIMLYFDLERVDIDFNILTKSIGLYIYGMMVMNVDGCETIEDFFDSFDDISEYIKWITDFITQSALPYGSREDVSDLFFKQVKKRFQNQVIELVNNNRFLPHDLFRVIGENIFEDLPQPTSTPEGSGLPTSSEAHAPERKSKLPNVSEHFAQSSEISSELGIEQGLDKMCIGAEGTSQKPHGATPKHKTTQNKDSGSCPFLAKFSGDKF